MEHCIGAAPYSFHLNPSRGWMEQAHELGCAIPQVLVRLASWLALWFQARARIGHALKRSRLIKSPHPHSQLLALCVSALDQIFLASASGSVTSTTSPLLPLPFTVPVSHQLRVLCQSKPASLRTFQIV